MLQRFSREIYHYEPYKHKIDLDIPGFLEKRLNSRGVVTTFNPSETFEFNVNRVLARNSLNMLSRNGWYQFQFADALLYSGNSPVALRVWQGVHGPSNTRDFNLSMDYFKEAQREDLQFIRRCLKESRFMRVKSE